MLKDEINRRQTLAGILAMSAALPLGSARIGAVTAKSGSAGLGATNFVPFIDMFGLPSQGRIVLDRADYDIGGNTLSWALSNTWVKGARGGSRIHGSARTLLNIQASRDCVFEDLVFEVTARTNAVSSYEAIIRSAHVLLKNHRFIRCRFVVRQANQNALKFIAESGDARIESLHFEDCTIDGAGRMGIELQNHAKDRVERLTDFRWQGGAVRNTGLLSGGGMGISLSGIGTDHVVDTLFENNLYAALENVGSSNSRFSGRSRGQTRGKTAPISFTNARTMHDNVIADFVCLDRASGGCRIWNQADLTMRNNRFIVSEPVDFRGVANLHSSGDHYDSSGRYVLSVGPYPAFKRGTQGNVWEAVTLDARAATAGVAFSAFHFAGDDTRNNALHDAVIWEGSSAEGKPHSMSTSITKSAEENRLTGATTLNGKRLR